MDAVTTRPPKGYAWGAVTIQRWALVGDARVVTPASRPGADARVRAICACTSRSWKDSDYGP
jgi:hypothetical protein